MSGASSIEWTDATWNPVRGCVKISPGCKHCYAETFAERFRGVPGHPYERGFDPRLVEAKLGEPLSWGRPRRVFGNSMSDLFQEAIDTSCPGTPRRRLNRSRHRASCTPRLRGSNIWAFARSVTAARRTSVVRSKRSCCRSAASRSCSAGIGCR